MGAIDGGTELVGEQLLSSLRRRWWYGVAAHGWMKGVSKCSASFIGGGETRQKRGFGHRMDSAATARSPEQNAARTQHRDGLTTGSHASVTHQLARGVP
jgi:hypothetical protein